MSDRGRTDREADGIERRYEEKSLMLERRSEDFEVEEAVFDKLTLEAVYRLIHRKVINRIHGVIKAGKEARIYWGEAPEGGELAIKIYYTATAEFRRGMKKYIDGDPRFDRVRRDTRGIIYAWAQKEFKNLMLAEDANVNAPRPVEVYRNVLVMGFIGRDGVPAPLLREVELADPETFYRRLLDEMWLLYARGELVHGDLSEYNIMVWEDAPVIFDLAQAVLRVHPMSDVLIRRDIDNVNGYFGSLGVEVFDAEKVEMWVKGESERLS